MILMPRVRDFGKRTPDEKEAEQQIYVGRKLLALITAILLIVAFSMIVTTTITSSSGLRGCQSIVLSPQRNDCLALLANKTKNYSVCSYMSRQPLADACIRTVAYNSNDVSICSRMSTFSNQYSSCISDISYAQNNINSCTRLKGDNASSCAYAIARKNGFNSLTYCNLISNTTKRNLCSFTTYFRTAVNSKAPYYCSLLPNTTNSTLLNNIVPASTNKSASDFVYLSALNMTARSYCYYNLAITYNNKTLCGFTQGVIASVCSSRFNATVQANLTFTNLTSLCATAPSYAKSLCSFALFTQKAIAQKNVTSCFQIKESAFQNSCIVQLAAKYNDTSFCNYIARNDSVQSACQESAAIKRAR